MQTLTHQLERKENEVEKAQEKVRKANADLDAMKRSNHATTTQLRDAHEKEVRQRIASDRPTIKSSKTNHNHNFLTKKPLSIVHSNPHI